MSLSKWMLKPMSICVLGVIKTLQGKKWEFYHIIIFRFVVQMYLQKKLLFLLFFRYNVESLFLYVLLIYPFAFKESCKSFDDEFKKLFNSPLLFISEIGIWRIEIFKPYSKIISVYDIVFINDWRIVIHNHDDL